MASLKIPDSFSRALIWIILFAGILLRLVVYFQNRSLFLDEANLSRNIAEKSFPQFFAQLDYEQYAPPFYLAIQKIMTLILGVNEYALRFFPLIAGLISLLLFYGILKHFVHQKDQWFPLALMAFSIYFVQYSTEVKQYASDIILGLSFILFTLKVSGEKIKIKHILALGVIGMAAIWLSMSVVFILAGVGFCYLFQFWQLNKQKEALALLISIFAWLLSFGAYYWFILRLDIGSDYLQNFHAQWFLPFIPSSGAQLKQFSNIMLALFRTAIGSTTLAIVWGITTSLLGIYVLFKKDRGISLLLIVPVLACFFASAIHYYTLIPRLTLFFIPIILIWIGVGTATILQKTPFYVQVVLTALLVIISFNRSCVQYFFQRFEIEELQPVMVHLKEEVEKEDILYVYHLAVPAFEFYDELHQNPFQFSNQKILSNWDAKPSKVLKNDFGKRIWLIFSHASPTEIKRTLDDMKKKNKLIKSFEVKGASCYLFE